MGGRNGSFVLLKFNFMKSYQTDIKCGGCLAKVAPHLNEEFGQGNWKVDIHDPRKVLTIELEAEIDDSEVQQAVSKAGFYAKPLEN